MNCERRDWIDWNYEGSGRREIKNKTAITYSNKQKQKVWHTHAYTYMRDIFSTHNMLRIICIRINLYACEYHIKLGFVKC